MRSLTLVLALAVASPLTAQAQRRAPTMSGMRNSSNRSTQRGAFNTRTLHDLNPARILIGETKALALDEVERARLDTLAKWLDGRISLHLKVADSLQKVVSAAVPVSGRAAPRPPARVDSARMARQDSLVVRAQSAKRDFLATLVEIKQDFDSTAARSTAALPESHRAKGSDMVTWAIEDVSDVLHRASTGVDATGRRGGD